MESFQVERFQKVLTNYLLPSMPLEKLYAMHVGSRDISPEIQHAEQGPMMWRRLLQLLTVNARKQQSSERVQIKAINKGG